RLRDGPRTAAGRRPRRSPSFSVDCGHFRTAAQRLRARRCMVITVRTALATVADRFDARRKTRVVHHTFARTPVRCERTHAGRTAEAGDDRWVLRDNRLLEDRGNFEA